MDQFDIRLFTLSAVVFTALACLFIIIMDIYNERERHRRLKIKLTFYLLSQIITTLCFIMYFYNAPLLIWFNWLFMLNIILIPVFLYAFIFEITTIDANEKFSNYHYIAPVVLSLTMLLLSVITPIEEQLLILKSNGIYNGGSSVFVLFSNKLIFRLIFCAFYVILSFRRLPRYRKYIINYSANEAKASLRWVSVVLFFIVSLIIVPLYGAFISRSALASSYIAYFQICIFIIQCSYLVYHVVKRHYILQEMQVVKEQVNPDVNQVIDDNSVAVNNENHLKKSTLNKQMFNSYMEKHKPYLNDNLKITDLAEEMGMNRTYISSFINTKYGMNFSTYINQLRLKEYEQLRNSNNYKNITNSELAEKVGFGTYRSYTRFAAQQKQKA